MRPAAPVARVRIHGHLDLEVTMRLSENRPDGLGQECPRRVGGDADRDCQADPSRPRMRAAAIEAKYGARVSFPVSIEW